MLVVSDPAATRHQVRRPPHPAPCCDAAETAPARADRASPSSPPPPPGNAAATLACARTRMLSQSPVYGNNPSFRVYSYSRETKEILDYAVHTVALLAPPPNTSSSSSSSAPAPASTHSPHARGASVTAEGAPPAWSTRPSALKTYGLSSLGNRELTALATSFVSDTGAFSAFYAALKAGTYPYGWCCAPGGTRLLQWIAAGPVK